MSGVMRGVFQDNSASFEGGAIFADSSSAGRLASEYNHSLAQGTFGPCFLVFGNELRTLTNTNVSILRNFILFEEQKNSVLIERGVLIER